jgi:hypothetical protein
MGIELPNPEKERYHVQPTAVYSARADADGAFEFFLGDGNFDIRPPEQDRFDRFVIAGEDTKELHATRQRMTSDDVESLLQSIDEAAKP